jgi:choline/glycine/proline betaine transport protein
MDDQRDFHYQVAAVKAPVPMLGARSMSRETDVYYRLEVFTQTGSEGYDLMGLTQQQIINDVLDRYETHLSFLRYSTEHDYASVLTPPRPPITDSTPQIPVVADDVERVGQ